MQFKDVIGQEEVKQQLVEMVAHNRLSHALLFLGREGSGALPLAIAFANYISLLPDTSKPTAGASLFGEEAPVDIVLPATPEAADQWMQQQSAFSKGQQMVHPDIHFSYPVVTKKSGTPPISTDYISEWREFIQHYPYGNIYDWLQFIGAENKQGNITAHECNDIIRKLNLKSFESTYKILILWMPEYLGKEGNKLLKLIEEPPANTLFILVAESEGQILSTILSRCQLVKIPSIDTKAVEAQLQKAGCNPDQARQIAGMSEGNFREALQLLQHADEDFHDLLREWLNAILKNQPIAVSKVVDDLARLGREKQKQFLRYFNLLLEESIRLRVLNDEARQARMSVLSATELDFTARLNKMCTIEQQDVLVGELDRAAYHIERNANAKILFHALSIKIFHIVKNDIRILV